MPLKTVYQEVSLELILKYFVENYRFDDGLSLFSYSSFVDLNKGVVVFRMNVNAPSE